MKPQRFEFALGRLDGRHWPQFETLAAAFLAAEFPELRTLACASGDRGRDGMLFSPHEDPTVVLQYSVTDRWREKVRATAVRVTKEFPDTRVLIYVTNQSIGARADVLRAEITRDFRVFLDIRDRQWFVERMNSGPQQEAAAENLAVEIVDPYLTSQELIAGKAQALTTIEARGAFLYLGLQWEDDTREKGLTKLSFEALVRFVLRNTSSETRKTRAAILSEVRKILPAHPSEQVDGYTNAALSRLTKRSVRHWTASDEFCLTHEEALRLIDRLAVREGEDSAFRSEVIELVERVLSDADYGPVEAAHIDEVTTRARRVLEKFIFSRGEAFASAVQTGRFHHLGFDELKNFAIRDMSDNPDSSALRGRAVPLVVEVVTELISRPSAAAQRHLRSVADSYTLFAFLRETPDVQSAVAKIFSRGEIWLDSSIALPLFAETLLEEDRRQYSRTLATAKQSGLSLWITKGVVEELERHMNKCVAYARLHGAGWEGRVPFLYSLYVLSGRPTSGFASWLELFRGDARPSDDIADYLEQNFGIQLGSLERQAAEAPGELRAAIQEIWHEAHERRRSGRAGLPDPMSTHRLVEHDVENYLGVVEKRRGEERSPLGYDTWWLTLDHVAFGVEAALRARITAQPPASPVLSPDFLVNYLAFGPIRQMVSKESEAALPVVEGGTLLEFLPPELLSLAEKVREESKDLPEHVIRRKVRDALDAARRRQGPIATGGTLQMQRSIEAAVAESTED